MPSAFREFNGRATARDWVTTSAFDGRSIARWPGKHSVGTSRSVRTDARSGNVTEPIGSQSMNRDSSSGHEPTHLDVARTFRLDDRVAVVIGGTGVLCGRMAASLADVGRRRCSSVGTQQRASKPFVGSGQRPGRYFSSRATPPIVANCATLPHASSLRMDPSMC